MISLIVPTMWRYSPFIEYLDQLINIDVIGEIIIINNDVNKTPDLKHPKLNIINNKENIYVCPSWNLGAQLAKYDKLGFLSDDAIIDTNVFAKVDEFLTKDIGMIGILAKYNEYAPIYEKFYTDGSINFVNSQEPDDEKRPPATGIGNLFFLNKKDWKDIPEEIKIFHGEVLQWNRIQAYKSNYIITNCRIETPWHVTWKSISEEIPNEFCEIQKRDQEICESMSFIF
jgi:hypothetical protein